MDKITRNHDVDLLLPGKRPCVYFVIISAQDSAYRFLSSLFFSLALPQLSNFARLQCAGGRLPVLTNFCLDEYCNIGYLDGVADSLNSIRGFNMSAQIVVQSLSQWQGYFSCHCDKLCTTICADILKPRILFRLSATPSR